MLRASKGFYAKAAFQEYPTRDGEEAEHRKERRETIKAREKAAKEAAARRTDALLAKRAVR